MGKHEVSYDADDESEKKLKIIKKEFPKYMEAVVGQRISREVSLIHRRLDALSRLLEHDQICVAVRYDINKKKIIISSNKIHQTSRKTNMHIKNIEKMMKLLANNKSKKGKKNKKPSFGVPKNLPQKISRKIKGKKSF